MSVEWGVVVVVGLVGALGLATLAWWRARRPDAAQRPVPVAHTARLQTLPRYQARARSHRRWLIVGAAATAALVLAGLMLAARPVRSATVPPVVDNRDIMLCLDVSGSMVEYNRSILGRFAELVETFDGERIGMTIFNSSAVPAFPLTTDHRFVIDEFAHFRETFEERGIDALAGTLEGEGSSLVPDGIASCALALPDEPDGRSRAMVVATDNIVEGAALLTMPQVTALMVERDVRVYALFPLFSFESTTREETREIRDLARTSGGAFFGTENPTAVPSIIDEIEALEVARLAVEPADVRYAEPTRWVLLAAVAAVALGLAAWRARL